MSRRIFYWKLRNSELPLGERTLIMGVLNVTPDSFSDGGVYRDPDRAYARALELEQEGADIIDVGAESTRPGSARISADEEWQRLVPVLKRLRGRLGVPLSLDTYKSEIAERAIDYGVEIINDPSGLTFDPNMAKVAASANAGLILNHMRGTPESWAKLPPLPDAPAAVARDLEATVNRARRAGVEQNRIAIDPGLGFGKRGEQNAEIIAHLGEITRLELPIVVGPSRKSFLRQKTDEETIFATAAAITAAILRGAHIIRVHDVKHMAAVAAVADEIARAAAVTRVQTDRAVRRPQARPAEHERHERIPLQEIQRAPLAPPAQPVDAPSGPEARSPERRDKNFDRPRTVPPREARTGPPREDGGARFQQGRGGPFRGGREGGPGPSREDRFKEGQFKNDRRGAGPRNGPPRERRGDERPPRVSRPDQDRPRGGRPSTDRGPRPPRTEGPRGGNPNRPGARPPKRIFRKRP